MFCIKTGYYEYSRCMSKEKQYFVKLLVVDLTKYGICFPVLLHVIYSF